MTSNEIKLLVHSCRQEALLAFVQAPQDSTHSKLRYLQGQVHMCDALLHKIEELEKQERNENDD
jgi:hypothetical protein